MPGLTSVHHCSYQVLNFDFQHSYLVFLNCNYVNFQKLERFSKISTIILIFSVLFIVFSLDPENTDSKLFLSSALSLFPLSSLFAFACIGPYLSGFLQRLRSWLSVIRNTVGRWWGLPKGAQVGSRRLASGCPTIIISGPCFCSWFACFPFFLGWCFHWRVSVCRTKGSFVCAQ